MLGYEHTGLIATTKTATKTPFTYRHLRERRRARYDHMPGYTASKRTTAIETQDCIDAKEDYVVWLEHETQHRRVVTVEVGHINDLSEDRFIIMELE